MILNIGFQIKKGVNAIVLWVWIPRFLHSLVDSERIEIPYYYYFFFFGLKSKSDSKSLLKCKSILKDFCIFFEINSLNL